MPFYVSHTQTHSDGDFILKCPIQTEYCVYADEMQEKNTHILNPWHPWMKFTYISVGILTLIHSTIRQQKRCFCLAAPNEKHELT